MKTEKTWWARIYLSGPIDVAKQTIRAECLRNGLCVTVEPTTFIYTGGEESGIVVGLIQYPRFPAKKLALEARAVDLARKLRRSMFQRSVLVMFLDRTEWISDTE